MSTSTSLTERVRAARDRRGFTEDQLQYDPLLRSMIEHVARSESVPRRRTSSPRRSPRSARSTGCRRTSTASGARSRESWRGGGIRRTSATGAAADGVGGRCGRIRCAEADDGDYRRSRDGLGQLARYVLRPPIAEERLGLHRRRRVLLRPTARPTCCSSRSRCWNGSQASRPARAPTSCCTTVCSRRTMHDPISNPCRFAWLCRSKVGRDARRLPSERGSKCERGDLNPHGVATTGS